MKTKIIKALGPFFVALVLTGILIFIPLNVGTRYSQKQLTKFAQAPYNTPSFTGYSVKKQAFSNPNFLPLLGSSELGHIDPFHPSAYFSKYPAGFTPYLAGQPGTTTLTHFFYVNSVAEQLKNRKIVFIISPQWFSKRGITESEFENFISKGEIYSWIKNANSKSISTQKMAQRLLSFKSLEAEKTIHSVLERLAVGKDMTSWQHLLVSMSLQFWRKEDLLFSGISQLTANHIGLSPKIRNLSHHLPQIWNIEKLDRLAYLKGRKAADNNPFCINNTIWKNKMKAIYKSRKNRMGRVNYLRSPEYTDFQQLLNTFAANHDDVLFVIQPVNGNWYRYSGLSEKALQDFSVKIRQQLNTQGFNQVADFTGMYNTPYAVGDTIHFGYRGWLAVDQSIKKFMKQPSKVDYHLDNSRFLSQEWAMNEEN